MKIGAKTFNNTVHDSEKPKLDTYEVANFDLELDESSIPKVMEQPRNTPPEISSQNSQGQDSVTNGIFADCSKPNDYVKYDEK